MKDTDGNGYYDVNDFLNMKNEEILEMNNGKKFDIILMNPPYSKDRFGDGLYVDFLNKCIDISDKVISVNPLNMLISHGIGGALKNKTNKIVKYINEYKPKIEVINKSLFDAGIKGDLCIISFNGNNKNIIINKDSKIYKFKEHKDINFTSDYVKIFKSKLFKYMIGEDINDYIHLKYPKIYTKNKEIKIKHDNLYNHLKFNGGEPYAKMNAILDKNPNKNSLFIYIYKINASFAGILYKSLTYNNAVEYSESTFAKGSLLYIELNKNDYKKSENICSYLKTDFCKLITNLAGEYFHPYLRYDFIPWLDFSKSYNDEELFKMIGIEYNELALH